MQRVHVYMRLHTYFDWIYVLHLCMCVYLCLGVHRRGNEGRTVRIARIKFSVHTFNIHTTNALFWAGVIEYTCIHTCLYVCIYGKRQVRKKKRVVISQDFDF